MSFPRSGSLPSASAHNFALAPSIGNISRSTFDRSHTLKTTFDVDEIVPIYIEECVPADTLNMSKVSLFARMTTLGVPLMDNMRATVHFFFVPNRLVSTNWVRLMGERVPDPDSSIDFLSPQVTVAAAAAATPASGSLWDYFGLPTLINGLSVIAYPFRGYYLVWNEWYRDQNLQDSLTYNLNDTSQLFSDFVVQKRNKKHDYFTSALPFTQKGPAVEIPLGTVAPVIGIGKGNSQPGTFAQTNEVVRETGGIGTVTYPIAANINPAAASTDWRVRGTAASDGYPMIYADLAQATAATINTLRESFQIQKFLERDARSGTRYTESIQAHFGVRNPDMRLQRPEFLGSFEVPVNITPVPQSSNNTDDNAPLGDLAAFATMADSRYGFSYSVTEHGFIHGYISVRGDITYQQGIRRMWSRRERFDWYFPEFQALGEQPILNQEIVALSDNNGVGDGDNQAPFGYQEAWAEYRYGVNQITGKMRSNDPVSLDIYHLAEYFAAGGPPLVPFIPTLNDDFIVSNTPIDRVLAVQDEPDFRLDVLFTERWARPMPMYSVPGFIDHF